MNTKQYSNVTILFFQKGIKKNKKGQKGIMITSRQNSLVRQFRASGDFVFVEGAKLINEAISAGFVPIHVLCTEKARLSLGDGATLITPDLSEYISDTKSPQGAFALFERKVTPVDFARARRVMLLDNVQDPGNVGAIARSCEAFGFDGLVLSQNSADLLGRKVVRASAGSVFRLPSVRGVLTDIILQMKHAGFKLYAADLDESAVPLRQLSAVGCRLSIVTGNEGQGVSDAVRALCDGSVYIPIRGAESLNAAVAAGIICYELGVK
jgi:TrmH family RNA methyltransferase